MITEDYVSFETAKLLKEKGFDGDIHWQQVTARYVLGDFSFERWDWGTTEISYKEGEFIHFHDQYFYYTEVKDKKNTIAAPTLQMAMKWLREEHNIFIDIHTRLSLNADRDICFSYMIQQLTDTYSKKLEVSDGEWLVYEEACEAAIKYCLENLI